MNPADYGWKWNQTTLHWEPVWYEGNALPDYADINDHEIEERVDGENDAVEDAQSVGDENVSDEDDDHEDDDESDCVSSDDESSDISDTE